MVANRVRALRSVALFAQPLGRVALGVWLLFAVVPAVLSALAPGSNPDSGKSVTAVLGPEVGRYLAYCPQPIAAYAVAAVVFCPVLLLLIAIADRHADSSPRQLLPVFLHTLLTWLAVHCSTLALVSLLTMARTPALEVWDWTWRIGLALAISGLPPAGIASLLAVALQSRRRSLVLGLCVIAVIGSVGVQESETRVPLTPGAVDRVLLSGVTGIPWTALLAAVAWSVGALTLASLLIRRRRVLR